MSVTLFGNTTIQPLETNVSASQQQSAFIFLSNDSGSYIYSGSDPYLGVQQGYVTFEDSGSLYSFVFSGSGFVPPSDRDWETLTFDKKIKALCC